MRYRLLLFFLFYTLTAMCGNTVPAGNDSIPPGQISIMTYNIKMLPRGGNSFLHHRPVARARRIPAKLIAENPDVIVFQEAFDGVADRILRRGLRSAYPYNMGFKNRKIITYKRAGGVLIFSKYPMKEIESIKYTQCKGIDCIGHKGALLVEVEHPAHRFQLLGTHMQAGGSRDLKLSQYAEAGDLLRRHEKPGLPQFVAGDFNTHKDNAEMYQSLMKAIGAEDGEITGDLQFTSDHSLNDMENYDPKRRRVIDYVFFRGNGVKCKSADRCVRRFQEQWSKKHKDLSDHFALILKTQM